MTVEQIDRLFVRFNAKDYHVANMARIYYENENQFAITWERSGHVKVESNLPFNNPRGFDKDKWKIDVPDKNDFIKVWINNIFWIIEKWERGSEEALRKYGRTMKGVLDIKVDYGRPY